MGSSGSAESGESAGTPIGGGGGVNINLVQLAAQVKAAQEILDRLDGMGERSIKGEIDNLTRKTLMKAADKHESGGFTGDIPKLTIEPHSHMVFGSTNRDISEGTVGWVSYRADDGTTFRCGWHNPLLGDGVVDFDIQGPNSPRYAIYATCATGNTGSFRHWAIFPLQEVLERDKWRTCRHCLTLYYDGYEDKGTCPRPRPAERGVQYAAAAAHEQEDSYNYLLQYGAPALEHEESDWRYCEKCHVLFYDGWPDNNKGVCAGEQRVGGLQLGGAAPPPEPHRAKGDRYNLDHATSPPRKHQGDWRYCVKCFGLVFDGWPEVKGYCANGGKHQTDPQYTYRLNYF